MSILLALAVAQCLHIVGGVIALAVCDRLRLWVFKEDGG